MGDDEDLEHLLDLLFGLELGVDLLDDLEGHKNKRARKQRVLALADQVVVVENLEGVRGRGFVCYHLGKVDADLLEVVEDLFVEHLPDVHAAEHMHRDVVGGGPDEVEGDGLQDLALLLLYLLGRQLAMCDLVVDDLELHRVNLLVLAGHEHGSHSDKVQIRYLVDSDSWIR